MQGQRPPPLIPSMQAELPPRGNKRLFIWLGAGLGGALLVGVIYTKSGKPPVVRPDLVDRPPGETIVVGTPGTTPESLRYPASYLQAQEKAAPAPAQVPTVTGQPPATPAATPAATPPAVSRGLPPPPGRPQAPQIVIQGGQPAPPPPAAASRQPAQPPEKPKRWFSSPQQRQGNVLHPPVPDDKDEQQQSKVFPKATWEKPANVYKVLYADQIIPVQLAQSVSTDAPGSVRMKVSQDVEDRWGHGHVLIPRDSTFVAMTQGKGQFGQEKIPLTVYMGIFPDGSAMLSDNGTVGDEMGSAGLPAEVDNHWGKLLAGIGLRAILNLSTRAPSVIVGSTGQVQGLTQEALQELTQGANRASDRVLDQFIVPPTLSQKQGYPATIQFLKNISFQTPPVEVRK
jgi:type IV secretory pathway VirB10-like protein